MKLFVSFVFSCIKMPESQFDVYVAYKIDFNVANDLLSVKWKEISLSFISPKYYK